MRILTAAMIVLFGIEAAEARIVPHWPYEKLADEADFVAVVAVDSIEDANDPLMGHGEAQRFQGKTAHLRVGWVIKGEAVESVDMLYFTYSRDGQGEPNGALFISFEDPAKHQYLVFLKRKGKRMVPVTGHYDARISVKVMREDSFSPIK